MTSAAAAASECRQPEDPVVRRGPGVPGLRLVRELGCAALRLPSAAAALAGARQGGVAQLCPGIPAADATPRPIGWYFTQGKGRVEAARKVKAPHPDLGAPNERPWDATNCTAYQDCNLWKDLASDYVLQVWRTFKLAPNGEDLRFLAECWPAAVEALRYLKTFDINNDGLPDNGGAPDQTFDDWPLKGVSACGALWIAALEAALAIAQQLQLSTGLDTSAEQQEFALGRRNRGGTSTRSSGTASTTTSTPRAARPW